MKKYPRKVIAQNTDSEDKTINEFHEITPGSFIGLLRLEDVNFQTDFSPPDARTFVEKAHLITVAGSALKTNFKARSYEELKRDILESEICYKSGKKCPYNCSGLCRESC